MKSPIRLAAAIALAAAACAPALAQSIEDRRVAGAVLLLAQEPPARIFADPPLIAPLSRGEVVIRFRTDNLQLVPVFGESALGIAPRVGHLHVTLDDAPWVWVHASSAPVRLTGLKPGRHRVRLELESPAHQEIAEDNVEFTVPTPTPVARVAAAPSRAAKLIIDRPMAEPLSRGVLLLDYRAEGLRLLPVFGEAALGVLSPVGHVHVAVDGASWAWEDASGGPIVINGLAPGRHQIQITLVNADHQPLDQGLVSFIVPAVPRR